MGMKSLAACFYSKQEYEKLLRVSDDRDSMCDTYDEWLFKFMQMKHGMEEYDTLIVPYFINIDELQKWCVANNKQNTGSARASYVVEVAKKSNNDFMAKVINIQV